LPPQVRVQKFMVLRSAFWNLNEMSPVSAAFTN